MSDEGHRPTGVGWGVGIAGAGMAQLLAWIAAGAPTKAPHPWEYKALAIVAGVSVGINWLFWIPACIIQTEKFYDLVGSLTHLTLIYLSLYLGLNEDFEGPGLDFSKLTDRQLALSLCYTAWAVRLGTFLAWRGWKYGDKRFEKIKVNPETFFSFWSIQGLWVFLTGFCVVTLNTTATSRSRLPLGAADVVGITLFAVGLIIEAVADLQKTLFKLDPANKGKWIESGLWYYSRHPNYFGEITLWIGVTISAFSVFVDAQFVTITSPMFVMFLLFRVSGIPTLESKADKKWGDLPEYQHYKQTTWELLILPRKSAPAAPESSDTSPGSAMLSPGQSVTGPDSAMLSPGQAVTGYATTTDTI